MVQSLQIPNRSSPNRSQPYFFFLRWFPRTEWKLKRSTLAQHWTKYHPKNTEKKQVNINDLRQSNKSLTDKMLLCNRTDHTALLQTTFLPSALLEEWKIILLDISSIIHWFIIWNLGPEFLKMWRQQTKDSTKSSTYRWSKLEDGDSVLHSNRFK